MQLFRDRDYRIWDSGTNFHVTPPGLRGGVDLFPCYRENGLVHMMMERWLYRSVPEDIILPTTKIGLYGRTLPAPANPEQLMVERYGETWHTPDPYHEWPWELGTQETPIDRDLAPKPTRTMRIAWGQHLGPGGYSPPKNSAAVIKEAIKCGFDAVEIDIREAGDGKFILAHDDLIVNGDDKIVTSEHTTARLKKFRIGDGIMLYWPLYYEDITDFMRAVNAYDLSALFYCHGSWPGRGEQDDPEVSFRKMIDAGVHFVTTTACDTKSFKLLGKRK